MAISYVAWVFEIARGSTAITEHCPPTGRSPLGGKRSVVSGNGPYGGDAESTRKARLWVEEKSAEYLIDPDPDPYPDFDFDFDFDEKNSQAHGEQRLTRPEFE